MLYTRAVAALLLLACQATQAFAGAAAAGAASRTAVRMQADDPIGSPFIKAINSLQEAFQNSPAAEFKKGLAKMQAGDYDEAAVKAKLDAYIQEPAVMFSFTTWPFCVKAKQVLDGYGAKYSVVELNEVDGGYALRAELAEKTGRTSVPALYVGGTFVGGCNDGGLGGVMTLDREGKLKGLLSEAGAL